MSRGPAYLILESQNSQDISQRELDALALEIRVLLRRDGLNQLSVAAVAHDAKGVGNHWSDVLNVFVPSVDGLRDVVWELLLNQIKSMMQARFSRPHESRRPRVIVVRNGDTGEVEKVLQATGSDEEFVELEIEVVDSRRPPPLRLEPDN